MCERLSAMQDLSSLREFFAHCSFWAEHPILPKATPPLSGLELLMQHLESLEVWVCGHQNPPPLLPRIGTSHGGHSESLGLRLAEYHPSTPSPGLELLMEDLESLGMRPVEYPTLETRPLYPRWIPCSLNSN